MSYVFLYSSDIFHCSFQVVVKLTLIKTRILYMIFYQVNYMNSFGFIWPVIFFCDLRHKGRNPANVTVFFINISSMRNTCYQNGFVKPKMSFTCVASFICILVFSMLFKKYFIIMYKPLLQSDIFENCSKKRGGGENSRKTKITLPATKNKVCIHTENKMWL